MAIVLIFLVGLVLVARFIFGLIAALVSRVSIWPQWSKVEAALKSIFFDHADGWLTAVATGVVAWFTVVLSKESRRQAQYFRPLLELVLTEEPLNIDPSYSFAAEDAASPQLAAYHAGAPAPLYIFLSVTNEQTVALGVAVNVNIELILYFGVNDNVSQYPFWLPRRAVIPVLGAQKNVKGAVFNVAGLDNYTIAVSRVTYQDASGRTRKIAYGTERVYRAVGQDPIYGYTLFQPAKREIMQ